MTNLISNPFGLNPSFINGNGVFSNNTNGVFSNALNPFVTGVGLPTGSVNFSGVPGIQAFPTLNTVSALNSIPAFNTVGALSNINPIQGILGMGANLSNLNTAINTSGVNGVSLNPNGIAGFSPVTGLGAIDVLSAIPSLIAANINATLNGINGTLGNPGSVFGNLNPFSGLTPSGMNGILNNPTLNRTVVNPNGLNGVNTINGVNNIGNDIASIALNNVISAANDLAVLNSQILRNTLATINPTLSNTFGGVFGTPALSGVNNLTGITGTRSNVNPFSNVPANANPFSNTLFGSVTNPNGIDLAVVGGSNFKFYDNDTQYVLEYANPQKDKFNISIVNRQIRLRAKRDEEKNPERFWFYQLPEDIQPDDVKATYKNDRLIVTIGRVDDVVNHIYSVKVS